MGNTKKLMKTKDVDQRPKNGERTTKVGAHGSVAVESVGQPIPVLVGYIPNKDREVTLPTRTTAGVAAYAASHAPDEPLVLEMAHRRTLHRSKLQHWWQRRHGSPTARRQNCRNGGRCWTSSRNPQESW